MRLFFGQMMRETVNDNISSKKRRSSKHARNSETSTIPDAFAHLQVLSPPSFNITPPLYFRGPVEESDPAMSAIPAVSVQLSDVPCPVSTDSTPSEIPLDSSGCCMVTTPVGVSQPHKVRTAPAKCGKCIVEHSKKWKALKKQHDRLQDRFKKLQIQMEL